MSPGRLIYYFYHRPIASIRQTLKTGVRRSIQIKQNRRRMELAAGQLREIIYPGKETFTIYFLTGKNYWYQTAFCLYSLQQQAGCNVHAVVVDDGSFDEMLMEAVRRQFPTTTKVVTAAEIQQALDKKLPATTFPVLRQRRLIYPHLRKLTDVHVLFGNGPKMVLDSDMLFFRKPLQLLKWAANPDRFLFMRDVEQSYGYSIKLMKELTGVSTIPERLNVGVAGVESGKINWEQLEHWTAELLRREGSSYLQEQALTAMLAANQPYEFLEENSYKVLPNIKGEDVPEVLHHYVADSKFDYFVKGWRMALKLTTG